MSDCDASGVVAFFAVDLASVELSYLVPDVSHVDDLAFVIMCTAASMVNHVHIVAEIAWECVTAVGFQVNFNTAESTVVARWHGHDAAHVRRVIALEMSSGNQDVLRQR